MPHDLAILAVTAASIGSLHTLLGPDHYLPFVVLARARGWSLPRTAAITILCGLGHVAGSLILGLVGIAFGLGISRIEAIEAWRGDVASWLLVAVGAVYGAWGLRRALRGKGHRHLHHARGRHAHDHHAGGSLPADLRDQTHLRAHAEEVAARPSITPWVLFIVFALGPCEPLIPLLMYPAATHSVAGLVLVTAVFSVATVATMLAVVALATLGVNLLPMGRLERFSHALAGGAIALSGVGIGLLGL